jgi:RNase P subunit RPR2
MTISVFSNSTYYKSFKARKKYVCRDCDKLINIGDNYYRRVVKRKSSSPICEKCAKTKGCE